MDYPREQHDRNYKTEDKRLRDENRRLKHMVLRRNKTIRDHEWTIKEQEQKIEEQDKILSQEWRKEVTSARHCQDQLIGLNRIYRRLAVYGGKLTATMSSQCQQIK